MYDPPKHAYIVGIFNHPTDDHRQIEEDVVEWHRGMTVPFSAKVPSEAPQFTPDLFLISAFLDRMSKGKELEAWTLSRYGRTSDPTQLRLNRQKDTPDKYKIVRCEDCGADVECGLIAARWYLHKNKTASGQVNSTWRFRPERRSTLVDMKHGYEAKTGKQRVCCEANMTGTSARGLRQKQGK